MENLITEQEEKKMQGLDFEALHSLTSEREEKEKAWLEQKRGKFSGSEAHRLMGYEDKDEFPKGAETYAMEKAIETLVTETESFSSSDMDWGNDCEVEAVEYLMDITGLTVTKYGKDQEFVELGQHVGCTPDGLIDSDGLIEGKSPKSKTHFGYLTTLKNVETFKKECKNYYWQTQHNMYVTGRKYCIFYSYDPRFKKPEHRLLMLKVERNDTDIAKLKRRLTQGIKRKLDYINQVS